MSFSYDLTTDIGKVRLRINDRINTSDEVAHFSDEELQIFLTSGGSVNLASAEALEAWAAALSDEMDSEVIGDYHYSKKAVANKLALADKFRAADSAVPVFDWAEMNLTGDTE